MAPVSDSNSRQGWTCLTCGVENEIRRRLDGPRPQRDASESHRSRSGIMDAVMIPDQYGEKNYGESCWNCGVEKGEACEATTRVVQKQIERVGDVEARIFNLKGGLYQMQSDLVAAIAEQQMLQEKLEEFGVPTNRIHNGKDFGPRYFGTGSGPGKGLGFPKEIPSPHKQRSTSAPNSPLRRPRTNMHKRDATPPKKKPMNSSRSQTSLEDFGLLSRERQVVLNGWLQAEGLNVGLAEGDQNAFKVVAACASSDNTYEIMKTSSIIGSVEATSPRMNSIWSPHYSPSYASANNKIMAGLEKLEQMGSKESLRIWSEIRALAAAKTGLESEAKQLDDSQRGTLNDFIGKFKVDKRNNDELVERRQSMRQQMLQMRKSEAQATRQYADEEEELTNTFSQACATAGLHVKFCLQRLEASLEEGKHAESNFTEFDVQAQRPLGLNLEERVTVLQVKEVLAGGVRKWNEEHRELEVLPDDQIIRINEVFGNAERMVEELKTAQKGVPLKLRLRRYGPWPGTVQHKLQELRDRVAELKGKQEYASSFQYESSASDSAKFQRSQVEGTSNERKPAQFQRSLSQDSTSSQNTKPKLKEGKVFNEAVFDNAAKEWTNIKNTSSTVVPVLQLGSQGHAPPVTGEPSSSSSSRPGDGDLSDSTEGADVSQTSSKQVSISMSQSTRVSRCRGKGRGRGTNSGEGSTQIDEVHHAVKARGRGTHSGQVGFHRGTHRPAVQTSSAGTEAAGTASSSAVTSSIGTASGHRAHRHPHARGHGRGHDAHRGGRGKMSPRTQDDHHNDDHSSFDHQEHFR